MFAIDRRTRIGLACAALIAFSGAVRAVPTTAHDGIVEAPVAVTTQPMPKADRIIAVLPRRDPFTGGPPSAVERSTAPGTVAPTLPTIPAVLGALPANAGAGGTPFPFAPAGPGNRNERVTAIVTGEHAFALIDDGSTTRLVSAGRPARRRSHRRHRWRRRASRERRHASREQPAVLFATASRRACTVRRFAVMILTLFALAVPARAQGDRLSIDAHDVELADVIRLFGAQSGRNVVADGSVKAQRVTLRLTDVTFDEALTTIVTAYGLQLHHDGRITIVGDAASMNRRYPDDASAAGTQTAAISMHHARPDDVVASLQNALPPGTVVIGDKRTGTVVITGSATTLTRARKLVETLDAPAFGAGGSSALEVIPLRHVRASEALHAIKGVAPDGAVFADDRQNAVVVTGNSELRSSVRALLTSIDAPGRQVMIEVRVADVQPVNDTTNVGVLFGGSGFGTGALAQLPYTLTKSSVVVNAQIDTLDPARPRVDPRPAAHRDPEQPRSLAAHRRTVSGRDREPADRLSDRADDRRRRAPAPDADDRRRRLDHRRAAPRVSQIIGFNNSFPIVANRKVDATLRVRDGETIVLGGLFQDVDSRRSRSFRCSVTCRCSARSSATGRPRTTRTRSSSSSPRTSWRAGRTSSLERASKDRA